MTSARPRTIQSIDRAVQILDLLASAPEGLSLTQIATRLNLPPQTAQSLLRTLQANGLAQQAAPKTPYRLGGHVLELARRFADGLGHAGAARPAVERLAEKCREYVLLAELQGRTVVHLVEILPPRSVVVSPAAETSAGLHSRATAKVLLAGLEPDTREQWLAALALPSAGPNAPRSATALRKQLRSIAREGFAVCVEEAGPGVAALAVPVQDEHGNVRAALGIALPLQRYGDGRPDLLDALRQTAKTIALIWHA